MTVPSLLRARWPRSRQARSPRRVALPAALSVVLLVLAGCGTSSAGGGSATGGSSAQQTGAAASSGVDVDTPSLRRAARQAGIEPCPAPHAPATGGLPDVTLPCLGSGGSVDLARLRGPLVVNLWAQWCGPCREELPYYEKLHRRAGGRLTVLGVDYQDTQPLRALQLADQTGVTYPLLADPSGQLRVPFRIRALPGIVLVDRKGDVVHLEYAVMRSYPQLRAMVEKYLHVAV